MTALIRFELQKVWRKGSFLSLMALLLLLNVFFLWYLNQPTGDEPPLLAYKAVCQDISGMPEQEKLIYIRDLKERADGLSLVEQVQSLYSQGSESGDSFAEQLKDSNSDLYEKYEELYRTGDYLVYTDSLAKERSLLDELYEEISAVSDYEDYLAAVQERNHQLGGISIFQSSGSNETFSSRNTAKSAADHAGLSSANIHWFPSKGMTMAVESQVTDLLLLLSVFLFVGQLITEEKGKGLFAITRSTKRGLWADMGARIAAVLIHGGVVCLLLYGSNLIYAGSTVGIGNLSASLQSLAPYMESSFPISIGAFLALGFITKTGVVFLLGLLLTACAVYSSHSFLPQLVGIGFLGLNWMLYAFIPSYSKLNLLKHLSYFSMLRTDALFGTYLNLNILGFPLDRTSCSLVLLAILLSVGIVAVLLLFRYGNRLSIHQRSGHFHVPFHSHSSLFRHEGYKILIANRGLLILLAFSILLGWNAFGKDYTPSAGEQYYRSMMLSLEGALTGEKEAGIKAEQARYDEAFAQIGRIDQMVADGSISENAGDSMKEPWYSELTFYPWFQRIQAQYERILSDGGVFIYDTGYLYLFGQMDDDFLINLLLISLCFSFSFANVMAMEDSNGLWGLLSATKLGRKRIIIQKWIVCGIACAGITLLPWFFRGLSISSVYPMGEIWTGIQSIPQYQGVPVSLPILLFLLLAILSQMISTQLICAVVLLLSKWRKNYFQTLFLALLLLAAPLVLAQMGLNIMKWFSVWPLYGWTGIIG